MNVVQILTNWHPIIQGALGSGFFWVVMELGESLSRKVTAFLEGGKRRRKGAATPKESPPQTQDYAQSDFVSLYSGVNYVAKGLIAMTISLGVKGIIPIFALIGFVVSIYFFFRALSYVPRPEKSQSKS